MKNIRFYEAEKYKTADYEIVDEKIYKTYENGSESDDYLGLEQLDDNALAEKLKQVEGWEYGAGEMLEDYLIPESVKFHFYKNKPISVVIFYRLHTNYNQSYRSKGHTTPLEFQ